MEGSNVANRGGLLPRLGVKAACLGVVAFLVGAGAVEPVAGWGALAGCLVAGIYVWGYIASHLARADRQQFVDKGMLGQTALRITALAVVSAAVFLAGRTAFVAYLIAFAVAFAFLLATEAPRVTRDLRSKGMLG